MLIVTPRIEAGAYEMKGTYGHIVYTRGEDPDRRIYGIPVKVMWSNQVQYRCSFVLQIGAEIRPGVWQAKLRGADFTLATADDGALHAEASFPDGTSGTIWIGREMGFGKRPVLLTAKSRPNAEGGYESKTFAGDVALRTQAIAADVLDPADPDLTTRSPSILPRRAPAPRHEVVVDETGTGASTGYEPTERI